MTRALPFAAALLLVQVGGLAQRGCSPRGGATLLSVEGRWEGANVHRGAEMKLVVDLTAGNDGLRGRLYQPDSPLLAGELTNVTYEHPTLRFEVAGTRLKFEGRREGEKVSGVSRDGEFAADFVLERTATSAPAPAYAERAVSFPGASRAVAGTLLAPTAEGPHPAVVLVHGSGPGPRAALRPVAEEFARRGLAALVYDKRDVGAAAGSPERVEPDDLVGDAVGAVRFLRTLEEVDRRRVGMWGVSQGGGVAAEAAGREPDVAFVISVSGGGVTYAELIEYQVANRLRAKGFKDDDVREALAVVAQLHDYVRTRRNARALRRALDEAWRKPWASAALTTRSVPTAVELATWTQWRQLDTPADTAWRKVKAPVLAVWGARDQSVPAELSAARIGEALRRAGNTDVTIKIFPGADHGLRLPMGEREDTGGAWDWPRLAPGYIELTTSWALERAARAQR